MAGKTANAINAWSAETIKALLDKFRVNGDLDNEEAVHALKIHLTAVSQYEQKALPEKAIKHLEGFKPLLDYQQENGLITEECYQALKSDANYLIGKWR